MLCVHSGAVSGVAGQGCSGAGQLGVRRAHCRRTKQPWRLRRAEGTPREQLQDLFAEVRKRDDALRSARRLLEEAEEDVLRKAQVRLLRRCCAARACEG